MKVEPFGPLEASLYREIVRRALAEDLRWGDITTDATVDAEQKAVGDVVAGSACVLAGLEVAIEAFSQLDPHVSVERYRSDGDRCAEGERVASLSGFAVATPDRGADGPQLSPANVRHRDIDPALCRRGRRAHARTRYQKDDADTSRPPEIRGAGWRRRQPPKRPSTTAF